MLKERFEYMKNRGIEFMSEQDSKILKCITLYIEKNYNADEILPEPEKVRDEFVRECLRENQEKP